MLTYKLFGIHAGLCVVLTLVLWAALNFILKLLPDMVRCVLTGSVTGGPIIYSMWSSDWIWALVIGGGIGIIVGLNFLSLGE
ncbi:MAG: hypothetical protein Kow0060_23620 [Methylohalobius crimeensis]